MLKRKLSLDETWRRCLKMWKWIVENSDNDDVPCLKKRYFQENRRFKEPEELCYFCEYDEHHYKKITCETCPGRMIDESFDCCDSDYYYKDRPKVFYKKLLELDKKRRAVKK